MDNVSGVLGVDVDDDEMTGREMKLNYLVSVFS